MKECQSKLNQHLFNKIYVQIEQIKMKTSKEELSSGNRLSFSDFYTFAICEAQWRGHIFRYWQNFIQHSSFDEMDCDWIKIIFGILLTHTTRNLST